MSQLSGQTHFQVATRITRAIAQRGRWLMVACLLMLVHGVAYAQLSERHSFNVRGDVEMVGNALLTCASCDQSNSGLNNGTAMTMRFVNVSASGLPSSVPQNSSVASLALPSGARVRSAGLYWGGRSGETNQARRSLQFRTPTGGYQAITASDFNTFTNQGDAGSRPYTAYRDVTALVAAAGSGTYAAGGLTSDITGNNNGGGLGNYGGWALIVLYEHESKPYRRLMVFDGNAGYVNGTNPQSVTVGNLLTPAAGEFTAYMGALVWEGDGGLTGDQFLLTGAGVRNPGALSDAQSPANNFWNSGISRLGQRFTAKNPDYVNQFAVDLKLVDISNVAANASRPRLNNGATGATLQFTSSQDAYFPHALVFVTDIFFPDVVTSLSKQARRAATGEVLGPTSEVRHGEEIEYVVSFTNNGQDGATRVVVTDPIPANTSYVPGSLAVVSNADGAASGAMTDAAGDDLADYDAATSRVVFRIGSGANPTTGGMLAPGQSASMSFRVRVNTAAPTGEFIRNIVSMRHNAQTVPLPQDIEGEAEANVIGPVVAAAADVGFCPVDGGFFNIIDGVGIYQYATASATDSRVTGLDFTVGGNLNGLMVDPTGRTRLLFHQATGGVVWAYDPTHPVTPGWYRTGVTINANLPRAGMTAAGVGYLVTAAVRAGAGATAQMYRIERDGDYTYRLGGQSTLTYDVAPSDFGSGDIAFDNQGVGWLVAGNDLFRVDVDAGTATRQQNFTGAPAGVNYAGAAFGGDGRLYVVNNSTGIYYAMDLALGTMEAVGTSSSGAGRDLASCNFPTIAPAQLQVAKTLASITRNGAAVPAGESAAPGDQLTYDIEIRHVGGTQAATVFAGDVVETTPTNTTHGAVADDFACTGNTCRNVEVRNILPGQSTAFTFVVQIDAALPSTVSQIGNTVTVNGIDCTATGNDCDENTPINVEPALTSSKTMTAVNGAAPAGPVAVGDVLTYTVVATNSGNVTLPTVTVTDARITPDAITCAPLLAGASCTLVGTYTVTQADANAGTIANTAVITTPDTPEVCPAGSTSAICLPTVEVPTETPDPSLTVLKTAGTPSGNIAGSTIGYSFLVTNTGNVTIANIAIDDGQLDAVAVCPVTPLAPGASTTCTGTHTITQAEVDAGEVLNSATATGTPPGGGTTTSPPDEEDVTLDVEPSLTIVKTAGTPSGNVAGSTIGYSFLVTNTGNVTITNIAIDDSQLDAVAVCPVTPLAPGASTTCTGTHTITQAEVDAGEVLNTATATGTPPGGGTTTSPPDEEDVTLDVEPSLTIVKTAGTPSGNVAGSTIGYSFLVTNTGNVTIINIAIDDSQLDAAAVCPVTTLAPGASTTCTGTHTITQAEVDAGEVLNTATATGTPPGGGTTTSPPDEEDVTLDVEPSLTVVKTAGTPSGNVAGSTIGYSFLVTNTGNVTIANIAIDDGQLDAVAVCPVTTLAPGASTTCTGTHTITQAEVDAGEVLNTATATGTPPGGGTTTSPPDEEDVTLDVEPSLTVVKTAGTPSGNVAGSTIGYSFLVTNTGNVTIANIAIDDSQLDAAAVCPVTTLAPGASTTCTGTHTITQAEVDAGEVLNSATATGTPPGGGTTTSPPDEEDVTIERTPGMSTNKALAGNADEDGSGTVTLGDTLTYTITATNTGTVTLPDVEIRDDRITPSSIVCASLAPGADCVLTGTYVVAQADVNAGQVINTAAISTGEPDVCPAGSTSAACQPTVTIGVTPYEIVANDDSYGPVNGADGDPSVGNLLDNDTLNGVPATPGTVTITVGTLPPGIVADPTTGVVGVEPGTPAGSYTFEYTICEVLNPSNCDTATVTVVVEAAEIVANDDSYGPVNGADGDPSVGNLLDNDTLNGVPATPGTVTITVGTLPPGIVADPTTGVVGVEPGTPAGTYTFEYTICEVLNPSNCDTATVTVVVEAAEIVANDDSYGPVNGAAGDPSVGNLLDNDTLNGVPATPGTVTITVGTLPPGIVADPTTGVVGVEPGTPAGSYTFEYTICEVLNPSNCDTATVTVVVEAAEIVANDDSYGPVNGADGDPSVGNLLDNDTLNGVPATPGTVTITVGTLPPGIVADPSTGVVGVEPGTPAGSYTFEYTICEVLNPSNCDTATVTVVVEAAEIVANDDSYGPVNGADGDPSVGNLLDNDTLNGVPATPGTVTITVGTLPPGIVADPTTGVVGVEPGTPAGTYTFEYTICEVLNPSNCDTATVTVVVEAAEIVANDDSYGPVNGADGDPSVGNLLDNDTLNGVPATPGTVTITVGTLPPGIVADPSTGVVGVEPGTPAGSYTFEYTICEVLNPSNCDTATVTVVVEAAEIVANDDSYGPVNGADGDPSVGNLLDNDTLNGVPATPGTVTITVGTLPPGIVADPSTGVVGVEPGTPAGSYTFEYTICELLNPENCDTATVTVVVEAPDIVAVDDSATTDQNTPVTIPVLDDDTLNGVPVDVGDITVVEVTPPSNGSIVIQPDGTVVYTPNPGFSGDDSFEYRICEIINPENCATATVTVTVRPNVVEAIDDDAGTAEPGVPTPVVVVDNDSSTGAPLDPGSVTVVTPPAHGIVNCANGICTYTPEFGFSGEDSFVYRVCDTSYPTPVCDTATVKVRVEGDAPLRITKSVSVREVKVGDLVRYTLTVENVGNAMVTGAQVIDTPPQGFSYVDGSIVSSDGRVLSVSGYNPIRIASLDLAPGDTMSISYLLRVGAGIRAGTHINQAMAQTGTGVPLSNIATAQVQTAFDPMLDDSLVFGTVFDDRNGDGWQASAALREVRVQGGFAPDAYVAGSTTIDRGDGPQPLADASAPLLHGVALDTIAGRQSVADPVESNQIVIRQRLRSAAFTGDFVLTSGDGATLRMAADGSTRIERSGDVAKGLSAAEPVVTRRVLQDGEGVLVEYVIGNAGIDERGIPGVRIASVEGLLIETDQYGRYHLVDVPGGNAMHGRNFILKVDPSTLPPGTEFTTANPLVRRVTPGLPVRFDFGVRLPVIELQGGSEVVELELGEVFFAPQSSALREAYLPAIEAMAGQIDRYRGGRVVVTGDGEHEALAFARAAAVRDALQTRVTPTAAPALTVELRTQVNDPHALVAGVDNGGVLLGTVLFDTDRAAIRPEFEALLDAVARRLEAMGGGTVGIVGHTDVRGSHDYNVELGLRRAQSVFDALSGRLSPQVRAKTRVETSRDPAASVGETRK